MAPYTNIPLSPAELSFLHTSLAQTPPIRPDGRAPTQFRPLVAETDILPGTNGSARICFPDGTEAVVGVKAEVEKRAARAGRAEAADGDRDVQMDDDRGAEGRVEVSVEIPVLRDDDAMPVFLAELLREALVADGELAGKLGINARFCWRLYVDILLLSQPLSYPLPLLSLTTHLALLRTRLPALVSERDEDPLFDDDWEASTPLYAPAPAPAAAAAASKPPITLLVMSVRENIFFDPSPQEIAVADAVVAVSCARRPAREHQQDGELRLVALRTIDPPSRLTAAGIPDGAGGSAAAILKMREEDAGQRAWRPPRGGVRRSVLARMIRMVLEEGGVGGEVMEGLRGVET